MSPLGESTGGQWGLEPGFLWTYPGISPFLALVCVHSLWHLQPYGVTTVLNSTIQPTTGSRDNLGSPSPPHNVNVCWQQLQIQRKRCFDKDETAKAYLWISWDYLKPKEKLSQLQRAVSVSEENVSMTGRQWTKMSLQSEAFCSISSNTTLHVVHERQGRAIRSENNYTRQGSF